MSEEVEETSSGEDEYPPGHGSDFEEESDSDIRLLETVRVPHYAVPEESWHYWKRAPKSLQKQKAKSEPLKKK